MRKEKNLQRLLTTGFAAILIGLAFSQAMAQETPIPLDRNLQWQEWRVMDVLAEDYGDTDWASVAAYMGANAEDAGNPNIIFIPLSLGNVYLNRYECANHTLDFDRALEYVEWAVETHASWGDRWLSPPVVAYLDLTVLRMRAEADRAGESERVAALWSTAMILTEEEADRQLSSDDPQRPYDSSRAGNSNAEEYAWQAALLAAAANDLPNHAHQVLWDAKARELAYDAITTSSDPADARGVKTVTVSEDFNLDNRGLFPNPTSAAATIVLLREGALAYRLSGRDVPAEFEHNVAQLYQSYKSGIDENLNWTRPSSPAGNAALFPLAIDPQIEREAVRKSLGSGSLWVSTGPIETLQVGDSLWSATLNGKTVFFYTVGSYLWHFPPGVTAEPSVARGKRS